MYSTNRVKLILIGFVLAFVPALLAFNRVSTLAQGVATAAPTSAATLSGTEVTLTLGAYSTPRDAFGELIPLFSDAWYKKTGQKVTFKESYTGSGAQSRAIVNGFEADIAALSLEADVNRIVKAKLIAHDWKKTPYNGLFATSLTRVMPSLTSNVPSLALLWLRLHPMVLFLPNMTWFTRLQLFRLNYPSP